MADSTILALDIKDKVVTGVLLLESKRSLKVLSAHCCFLDSRSAAADTQTTAGGASVAEAIGSAVAEVVQYCKAGGARCLVSFGAEYFQYRTIHLPFEDRKKARSVIPFEVEDSVSFSDSAFIFDYLLDPGIEGGSDVLVALVKKELLRGWLDLLGKHNLDPEVVTISGFPAAFNVCRYDQDLPGSAALLQVGFSTATLIAIVNGIIRSVRSFSYNLGQDAALDYDPESRTVRIGDAAQTEKAFAALAADVDNTLFALSSFAADDGETHVHVGGVVGTLPECRTAVQEALVAKRYEADWLRNADVEILDTLSGRWPGGALDDALALGCCQNKDRERLNFRKDEFSWRQSGLRLSKTLKAGSAVLALLVVAAVFYQVFDYQRMKHQRDQFGGEVVALYKETLPGATPGPEPVRELQIKINKLKETSGVDSGHDLSLTAVKLLADISARIPDDLQVTLERYLYDRKSIRMKGITNNFNTVDTMKKALEKSPFFSDVSIGSANIAPKDQGVRFELKLEL